MVSDKLKQFIEKNIELIETQQWYNLIKKCPAKYAAELFTLLRQLDSNMLMKDNSEGVDSNVMYGIKGSTRTVSAGAPRDGVYNVLKTINAGMKGGYQIGYKTLVDALDVCDKLNVADPEYRPYIMDKYAVDSYTWTEVDTVLGKAYVTSKVIYDYDPMTKLRHRAENQAEKKSSAFVESCFDKDAFLQELASVVGCDVSQVGVWVSGLLDNMYRTLNGRLPVISVSYDYRIKKRLTSQELLALLNKHATHKFVLTDPSKNNCTYRLADDSLVYNIQKAVYDKLGVV